MIAEAASTTSETAIPLNRVTKVHELVETIRDEAVTYALSKLAPSKRGVDLVELSKRPEFLSEFKCGLASGVGDALIAHDGQVRSIYLFDPTANPDLESGIGTSIDATVHLLVRVNTPSAALHAVIDAIDVALTQSIKSLGWPIYANFRSVLDIIPITEKDIRERKGFAALLTSIFAPPIRVCQKE